MGFSAKEGSMIHAVHQKPPITIHSNQLTVEIAQPGCAYTRTRFDWSGYVTQVTLTANDGIQHTFCVPESLDPGKGTGGWGLCNEFGNDKPIGYDEIKPGDIFPKLGIGLLKRRDHEKYSCFVNYEIVQPFPIRYDVSKNQVIFTVDPIDCHGYSVRLTKILSAQENWLEIVYKLENVGKKSIDTNEYNHNFTGFDFHSIGPEYLMKFPYEVILEDIAAPPGNFNVVVNGSTFTFPEIPTVPFYFRPLGFKQSNNYQWELTHQPSGLVMREYDDFPPSRVVVWGTTHVVSAEIIMDIHLSTGQEKIWKRSYEFIAKR
jgi:hypothetical protein